MVRAEGAGLRSFISRLRPAGSPWLLARRLKTRIINNIGVQLGLAFTSIILLLGGLALLSWGTMGKNQKEAQSLVEDRLSCVIQISKVREAQLLRNQNIPPLASFQVLYPSSSLSKTGCWLM